MNYLFFDIECCDGNHICSLGYVVVDKNFAVLEKADILINPDKPFKLGRAGFEPELMLAYPEEVFKKQKTFPYFYENIKRLLGSRNCVVLGHNSGCDIGFLIRACERYNLKKINITAFDTQKIFKLYKGSKNTPGLHNIIAELGIDVSKLKEHKSCDDAEMTMLIIKELCQLENLKIKQLLTKYKDCKESTTSVLNRRLKKAQRMQQSLKNSQKCFPKLTNSSKNLYAYKKNIKNCKKNNA